MSKPLNAIPGFAPAADMRLLMQTLPLIVDSSETSLAGDDVFGLHGSACRVR